MQCFVRMALVACQTVLAGAVLLLSHVTADDWPMFGREASHNGVSPESNPPRSFNVGEFDRKTALGSATRRECQMASAVGHQHVRRSRRSRRASVGRHKQYGRRQ